MTSIQDILSFLKSDKDDRAREKEEDRKERENARAEDMRKIGEMIKSGVKEEVSTVLKPLQDRLDRQEKVVEELTMQLTSFTKEMETLKAASVSSNCDFPILQHPTALQVSNLVSQFNSILCMAIMNNRREVREEKRVVVQVEIESSKSTQMQGE